MNPRIILIAAGLLLVGGLALMQWNVSEDGSDPGSASSAAKPHAASPTDPLAAPRGPGPREVPPAATSSPQRLGPEAEVEAARTALGAARERMRIAERELDDLEREIESVEKFVDNIEARGDDPARHAFEAMDQLNPIIEKYEARLATLEEAERSVESAQQRFDRAEAAVARGPGG